LEFAIDFMRFGPEDRLFTGDSRKASNYFGQGAPVAATEADGNFIMLDCRWSSP
jgi:hypothetical protein